MAFKDIFRIFRRKKKKTEDAAEQPAKELERSDPNAWPEAESAGEAGDPNAWPEPDAAGDVDGAETWPDDGAAASEGGEVWPEEASGGGEAWPDAESAPADGSDAWPETGDAGPGGEAAAWPAEDGQPSEAPADGSEEDAGKKGKKKKKAKKEKKPKKKKGEEGDEADEAAESGKKKPPLLLIIIPAVIVVAAAAVLLILKPWAPKDPKPDEDTEQVEPPAEDEGGQEEGGEEEPDPPETPPARPAAPEPMDTAGAMDHFATLSPASLGLEGESMSEYNYYATGRTVTVDGIKCREIMVYSVSASAGTNDIEGRYLLSMDGSKLFRDTGGGVIEALSPSVIGLGG